MTQSGSHQAAPDTALGAATAPVTELAVVDELRRSELLCHTLIENLPGAAVLLLDADLRVLGAAGDGLRLLSGSDPAALVGRQVSQLMGEVPAGARRQSLKNCQAALAGKRREFEFTSGGRSMFVQAVPIRDGTGVVTRVLAVVRDLTEQRRAETDLQTSELLYRTLAANIPNTAVGIFDRDLRWLVMEGAEVLHHLTDRKDPIEGSVIGSHNAGLAQAVRPSFRRVFDGESATVHWTSPNGRSFEVNAHPVRDAGGSIYAGMVAVTDVTDRDSAQATMRRLSAIVESSGDAIAAVDLNGRITSWNAAAEVLYGYTLVEVLGHHLSLVAARDRGAELVGASTLTNKALWERSRDSEIRRKDGTIVPVSITISPIYDGAGSQIGVSGAARDISENRRILAAAETDRERLAAAQEQAHVGSVEWNAITNQTWWSVEFRRILGLADSVEPSQLLLAASVFPVDLERVQAARNRLVHEIGATVKEVYRVLRPDGATRWVREQAAATRGPDGTLLKVAATVIDITDLHEAQEQGEQAEARFRLAFEKSPIGKGMADVGGRLTDVNPAFCRILGRNPDQLVGHLWEEFVPTMALRRRRPFEQMLAGHRDTFQSVYAIRRPDDERVWIQETTALVRDGDGQPVNFLAQIQDITERKLGEERLSYQASHDSLTGLPNRAMLRERVERALFRVETDGSSAGLFLLDLDGFKDINDSLGHAAGDAVLIVVAKRLVNAVDRSATVARLGGDEFAICLPGPTDEIEIGKVAASILNVFREPVAILEFQISVAASIGVALAPAHGLDASTLLRHADLAMYRAKSSHCGWALFDLSLDLARTGRLRLIAELGVGIRHSQLELHYQPIVDMLTGAIVSVEALVRWRHPTRGLLAPDDFITLAEQSGLIGPLTDWVVEAAVAQTRQWVADGAPLKCAVNLSVCALNQPTGNESLVARIVENRDLLSVEITESVLADARALAVLRLLASSGVSCAIDDFGTGYSSLSSLKDLPVDTVKIDRSFLRDLECDDRAFAIVNAILTLARALSLTVIVEGIETATSADRLLGAGVKLAQGYYYARPMPAAELQNWLAARSLTASLGA